MATRKPARRPTPPGRPGPGEEAVRRATGRSWTEWFALLDAAGGRQMIHRDLARLLGETHHAPSWWRQMIAVEYERARGLRAVGQKGDATFAASASKVIAAPVAEVFSAWTDARRRRAWLPAAPWQVRKATAGRSLRLTWDGGPTFLSVNFRALGTGRSQVALDHERLPDAGARTRQNAFWRAALGRLKVAIEARGPAAG